MMRMVRAADRRTWMVRSRISWTKPAMADQFEHDMAGGYVSAVAMLGVLVVLILFVMFWTPTDVVIPAWFGLLLLLVLLLIPVLWALQRPWVITAYTTESAGTEGEYWEGVVRGMVPAREETIRIADDLIEKGVPDEPSGPLTRIAPPESFRTS
ncbi:MAG: DUF983 domain-containing protein [Pseudonocardiaceae bacterium]